MCEFGKVVLSRKGFDSSAGGGYSPFDPQTGKYVVLPIPMGKSERKISNSLKYEEIHIERDCLQGYSETNLKSLMNRLEKKATLQTKDGKEVSEYAHFDPWLLHCPWLAEGSNHQIGAFGQVGIPQAHLHNKGVGEGSLFLFFSRFKPIKPTGQDRENKIVPGISPENLKKGLYFIYGWLKVKEVIQEYNSIRDENLLAHHPHATEKYFEEYARKEKGKNTLYIADKFLFTDGSNLPGCGYFRKLRKNLLLTATDSAQEDCNKWMPSRWKMPTGFTSQTCHSYLKGEAKWISTKDGSCLAQHKGHGQEFVFEESEEFCKWFRKLLESNADNV